jgi:hypothetical protein
MNSLPGIVFRCRNEICNLFLVSTHHSTAGLDGDDGVGGLKHNGYYFASQALYEQLIRALADARARAQAMLQSNQDDYAHDKIGLTLPETI